VSDHSEDFVSFEKALRDLNLRSEELKKLVSEGEIRAFRDGDSMKFKREDLDSLSAAESGDEELAFADALEDDTGMVTEELSDEDTLLAEDDLEDDVDTVVPAAAPARATRSPRVAAVATEAESKEPGWVIAAAILGCVVLLWGVWINQSIAAEADPNESFLTSMFGKDEG